MNKFRLTLNIFAIAVFVVASASVAQAQATRTWVSGVGDDVNPCSRTAPCKTYAGAISKTAANGEISTLDPGGFGAVTITKSITIEGTTGAGFGSILASLTNGVIINDSAASPTAVVTLRNLSIIGGGNGLNGIRVLKAKTVYIENVDISGFTGNGVDIQVNPGATGGTEVYLDNVDVRDLRGVASIGVEIRAVSGQVTAFMDHVRVERVPTAVHVNTSGFAFIRNSVFVSAQVGIEMVNNAGGSQKATIENTMLSNNGTGISAGTGTTTLLSQSTITSCGTGISGAGGIVQSSGNNRILGNANDGLVPTIINPK